MEGLTYDVGTTLANYLLSQGWAVVSLDAASTTLPTPNTPRRPSVLIVEDDEETRVILAQLLEHHGLEPHVASDGVEGLAALQRCRPSLILLDLAMPRMDGVAFRRVQQQLTDDRLRRVPVVVVSALHDAEDYKKRLHVAEVLTKPFEADALIRAVETYARPPNLFTSPQ
jgi:two-component system chemotaxis response regulator CheY